MSDELKTISVKQIRGLSGSRELHRKSVKGLGLKKINHVVDVIDTPANKKYKYFVKPNYSKCY